ncbi:hypothetical protein LSH36_1393g00020 [Paralvinella palmiformis]|uniref:Uncharacterized protein n=1 Tax=Paralvinella palmiformis TaxID=53620 RepID=A0AAD9MRG2_9ANNE|nr:hypothetical protein LSH36_1393g00020 [Paralvinella palmiformis]
MNKKTKNKQLDIHVRLWRHDQVHTRYLTSQFIGYAAATDLLEHFNASTSDLCRNGLLQVSMDGPSVNWSFYEKLEKEIKNECGMGLLNFRSCGLHVIHRAFQTGARETDWGLDGLLSSPYYLFKDTSARRDDFTDVTGCNEFPLKFCKQRLKVSDQEHSKSKCKHLLEELVTLNRVDGDDVDMWVASYKELLHDDVAGCGLKSRFKDFKVEDDRVDMLLYESMGRFEKLWRVVRKVLLVSHGQASVERGFSLNRQIEKDNMIVALRQIIDYFVLVGGMLKVEITKELLSSASSSRYRYHKYLEEDKRKKRQETIQRK